LLKRLKSSLQKSQSHLLEEPMKKLALLLLVAVLLVGCQTPVTPQPTAIPLTEPPASAPTSAPVEALASSVNELVGVWWFSQAGVMTEYKADGTYRVYAGSETQDEGTYTFDAGKITWTTINGGCLDKPATYEAYITKQDGKPAWLRMQVVGSDPCSIRVDVLRSKAKLQNP
jgi:hypothetical protein